jgi:hypothetical protein
VLGLAASFVQLVSGLAFAFRSRIEGPKYAPFVERRVNVDAASRSGGIIKYQPTSANAAA